MRQRSEAFFYQKKGELNTLQNDRRSCSRAAGCLGVRKKPSRCSLGDVLSRNSLRVYWALGLAVGDGVAAGCGAKLWWMRRTLSEVVFQIHMRIFQSSASRT